MTSDDPRMTRMTIEQKNIVHVKKTVIHVEKDKNRFSFGIMIEPILVKMSSYRE